MVVIAMMMVVMMGMVFLRIDVLSDETDDGNEQTESVADDFAGCNGSSKIVITVGVMR